MFRRLAYLFVAVLNNWGPSKYVSIFSLFLALFLLLSSPLKASNTLGTTISLSSNVRQTGVTTQTRIVRTSEGTFHAAVHLGTQTLTCNGVSKSGLVWIYSTDGGANWTCGEQLSTSNTMNASLVVDTTDSIHVLLSTLTGTVGNTVDVSYAKLTKGAGTTWTLGNSHTVLDGTTTAGFSYGSMDVQGNTRLWVAARSYDGATFQVATYYSDSLTPTTISNWTASNAAMTTGANDASFFIPKIIRFGSNLGVAYPINTGQFRFRARADTDNLTTWGAESTAVSANINATNAAAFSLEETATVVHLAYVDSSSNTLYTTYSGGSWAAPFQLGTSSGNNLALTTDGASVWVFYSDGTLFSGGVSGQRILYYKKIVTPFGQANADAWQKRMRLTEIKKPLSRFMSSFWL